jgi:biopolymer transport protein ExbB/TolQ
MNQDMSILQLVLNASVVVQLVMLLLLVVSVASWAAIFRKMFALKRVKFAQRFVRARFLVGHQPERPVRRRRPERQAIPARWSASSPAACANTRSCASGASPTPAP